MAHPCLPLGQALRSALRGDTRGAAPTGAVEMSMSTSTETPISTTRISTARTIKITWNRAGKNRGEVFNTIRAIERVSATEIKAPRKSSTEGAMPKRRSRVNSFAGGPRAAGRNWRVKEEVRVVAKAV